MRFLHGQQFWTRQNLYCKQESPSAKAKLINVLRMVQRTKQRGHWSWFQPCLINKSTRVRVPPPLQFLHRQGCRVSHSNNIIIHQLKPAEKDSRRVKAPRFSDLLR